MVGNLGYYKEGGYLHGLTVLAEYLETHDGADHEAIVYEAAVYHPVCEPVIGRIPLSKLSEAKVTEVSTLYISPKESALLDREMMVRLGMNDWL